MPRDEGGSRCGCERAERLNRAMRARPRLAAGVRAANRVLVLAFYAAYVGLLVAAALERPAALVPLVAVPAAGFALVSAVRARLDAPRPYERCAVDPLIPREGAGRSLPSRHAFSAFTVAASWAALSVPLCCALLACGCALAACRVLGGVHFPRDVAAGAAAGVLAGGIAAALALLA